MALWQPELGPCTGGLPPPPFGEPEAARATAPHARPPALAELTGVPSHRPGGLLEPRESRGWQPAANHPLLGTPPAGPAGLGVLPLSRAPTSGSRAGAGQTAGPHTPHIMAGVSGANVPGAKCGLTLLLPTRGLEFRVHRDGAAPLTGGCCVALRARPRVPGWRVQDPDHGGALPISGSPCGGSSTDGALLCLARRRLGSWVQGLAGQG